MRGTLILLHIILLWRKNPLRLKIGGDHNIDGRKVKQIILIVNCTGNNPVEGSRNIKMDLEGVK
jgi:hypothetical protein